MSYTVKKVKSFKGTDDYGYNADLYRDGRKVAEVINDGSGGEEMFYWLDVEKPRVDINVILHDGRSHTYQGTPEEKLLAEFANAQTWSDEKYHLSGRKDAGMIVGNLVDDYVNNKRFTRICKTKTLFRLRGEPKGDWHTVNSLFTPQVKAWLIQKYGAENIEAIWNERPTQ